MFSEPTSCRFDELDSTNCTSAIVGHHYRLERFCSFQVLGHFVSKITNLVLNWLSTEKSEIPEKITLKFSLLKSPFYNELWITRWDAYTGSNAQTLISAIARKPSKRRCRHPCFLALFHVDMFFATNSIAYAFLWSSPINNV